MTAVPTVVCELVWTVVRNPYVVHISTDATEVHFDYECAVSSLYSLSQYLYLCQFCSIILDGFTLPMWTPLPQRSPAWILNWFYV
jgi:hypothetical protein